MFSGCVIATDWQSIRGDPCDHFSQYRLLDVQTPSATSCCPSNFTAANFSSTGSLLTVQPTAGAPNLSAIPLGGLSLAGLSSGTGGCSDCSQQLLSEMNTIGEAIHADYNTLCRLHRGTDGESGTHFQCSLSGNTTDMCVQFNLTVDLCGGDNVTGVDVCRDESSVLYLELSLLGDSSSCLDDLCHSFSQSLSGDFLGHHLRTDEQGDDYQSVVSGRFKDTCSANASVLCQSFSGPPFHCFWNPKSRITGETCQRCEPICRSTQASLNFAQLIIGISLVFIGLPMGRILATIILSDIMGTASQVTECVSNMLGDQCPQFLLHVAELCAISCLLVTAVN